MNKVRRFNVHTHQFKDEPTVLGVVIEFVGSNEIATKLAEVVERVLSECLAEPLDIMSNEISKKSVLPHVDPMGTSFVEKIDSIDEYEAIETLVREKEGSWKEVRQVLLISNKELKKKLNAFGFERSKQLMDAAKWLTQQRYNKRKAEKAKEKRRKVSNC